MAILRTWLLFLLLRSAAVSRPILALFGQPGAGKSTLFRRVYTLLYGRARSIGAVTTPDDFDHAVSSDPLVVLDNVDSWERWLPDRLALSAGTSDITKRKLYTDADIVILKRTALIGITAHNPKFSREDVTDRLLLLTFQRLTHFESEGVILNNLLARRRSLWGGILHDLHKILLQPKPAAGDCPQFRVEDFASIGTWIARALDFEADFRSALNSMRAEQHQFSLSEEAMLVNGLQLMLSKHRQPGKWLTTNALWAELELLTSDPRGFQQLYRNPVVLGKKIWALYDSLKSVLPLYWKFDSALGTRLWKLGGTNDGREEDHPAHDQLGADAIRADQ